MFNISQRDFAIAGFAVGYLGSAALAALVAWLIFTPFGCGYIAAELVAGYLVWSTIYQWDNVQLQLAQLLETHNL